MRRRICDFPSSPEGAALLNSLVLQGQGAYARGLFNDASSALALNFTGQPNEDINNESWGLDNVVVKTDASPVPEAGTSASLGLMLAFGLGSLIITRRRKALTSAA